MTHGEMGNTQLTPVYGPVRLNTSNAISGLALNIFKSVRVGPVGNRIPWTQLRSVFTEM